MNVRLEKRPRWRWTGPEVGRLLKVAGLLVAVIAPAVVADVQLTLNVHPEVRWVTPASCTSSGPGRVLADRAR